MLALIGLFVGIVLRVIVTYIPSGEVVITVGIVVGAQTGLIPSIVFLMAVTSYGASSLIGTVIKALQGDIKRSPKDLVKTIRAVIMGGCVMTLPIALAGIAFVIGGGPHLLASMGALLGTVSVMLIVLVQGIYFMGWVRPEQRLGYILGCVGYITLAVVVVKGTGVPLAMGALISVLTLGKVGGKQHQYDSAEIGLVEGRHKAHLDGSVWFSTVLGTLLIGMPSSTLLEIFQSKDLNKRDKTIQAGIVDIASDFASTVLYLCFASVGGGPARGGLADALGRVPMTLDPMLVCLCIGAIWLGYWFISENLDLVIDWCTKINAPSGNTEWCIKVVLACCCSLLAGLSLPLTTGMIGIGIIIGMVMEKLNLTKTMKTIFSGLPLLGMTGLI